MMMMILDLSFCSLGSRWETSSLTTNQSIPSIDVELAYRQILQIYDIGNVMPGLGQTTGLRLPLGSFDPGLEATNVTGCNVSGTQAKRNSLYDTMLHTQCNTSWYQE